MHTLAGFLGLCLALSACGGDDSSSTADARARSDAAVTIDASVPDATMSDGGTALIPETRPSPLPTGTMTLKAVNYNAGLLAGVVKGDVERAALIVTELKAVDVDVICMEEIFKGHSTAAEFAAKLADTYPYSYWTWTSKYPQGNGLLLMSKHPMYRGRELYYSMGNGGPTVDRMAIGVTIVPTDNAWYANVLCTHETAGLRPVDNDTVTRQSQIAELKAWAMAEGYFDEQTILLGDFNAGPAWSAPVCECGVMTTTCSKECDPADTLAYDKVAQDWTDPFSGQDFSTSDRPQFLELAVIPSLFPDEPSQRIDHCWYRNLGTAKVIAADTKKVLTTRPNISINGGTETITYMSDHYGVQCAFGP